MEKLLHRAFVAAVAAVGGLGILMASAVTTAVANVEPEPAPRAIERADVSKLTPFNQTRGKPNTAHVRINSKQSTDFNITRVDDVTLRVQVVNTNKRRESGDHYRNSIILLNGVGEPVAVWYNMRGVRPRLIFAPRKTRSDNRFVQPKEILDSVAYYTVASDSDGKTGKFLREMEGVFFDGVKKGLTDLVASGVKMLGAAAGIKNPA